VYNRVQVKTGSSKTPFELFYGYKPDVSLIKGFGCEAFTLSFDTKKLVEKSIRCVFIGYGDALFYVKSIRGYRLLLPDDKVIIRRHVRFIEDSFPRSMVFSTLILLLKLPNSILSKILFMTEMEWLKIRTSWKA
jgi:hypothetical protein